MARKVRDNDLDSRTAREKLDIQGRPHFRRIQQNLHIGYRRLRGKSGTWTARSYVGNGEYAFDVIGEADDRTDANGVTTFNFDQAVAKAQALHIERANQAAGIHAPLTVEKATTDYVTHLDQRGKATNQIEGTFAKYVIPLLGDQEVGKLTNEMLTAWMARVAAMQPKGRRAFNAVARKSSANGTLGRLRAALNLAYRNGKVSSNKAWMSVAKFKGVDRRRDRFLSHDEAVRLINGAGDEFRPMVQAGLMTGCRYAELCNLKVADFHPDSKTLFIRTSKTGRSRSVYLTPEGAALFESLSAGRRGNDPLIRRDDGLPFNTSQQVRRMKLACKNARIDPVTFHGLRHTFASALIKNKTPLVYVAQSLGHTTINMVQKHYGHIEASHLAETIRANVPSYGFTKSNVATIKRRQKQDQL
jgi:integrase